MHALLKGGEGQTVSGADRRKGVDQGPYFYFGGKLPTILEGFSRNWRISQIQGHTPGARGQGDTPRGAVYTNSKLSFWGG